MAATTEYTYDIDPAEGGARRASLEDLGGGTVEDDDPNPDKGREVYADQMNELQRQIAGANKVLDVCILSVGFFAGDPAITSVQAMGTLVESATFTVTDEGNGVTLIEWDRGALPAMANKPQVSIDTDGWWGAPIAARVSDVTASGLDGVRVKTRAGATGTLTDGDFTVRIG